MKKVLLVSVQDIISASVIEDNVDVKLLSKTIGITQETGLKSILGTSLYTGLLDAVYDYTVSGTPLTAAYSALIENAKPYLIAQTVASFIIINNYKITNKGILKLNDNSATALSDSDIENVKNFYDNQISTFKASLIQFLRDTQLIDNRNDVQIISNATGWFLGTPAAVCNISNEDVPTIEDYVAPEAPAYDYQRLDALRNVLLISTAEIISGGIIEDGVDVKLLSRTIQTVQEIFLKPILTEAVYYPLLDWVYQVEVSGSTIPAVYSDLLTLIKPYMVNKVVAEFIIPNQYKFTAKGLLKLNDNSATALNENETESIKDNFDNISTSYKIDILNFLKKYKLIAGASDNNITSDATGWFLSNYTQGCNSSINVDSSNSNNHFFDVYVTGGTYIKTGVLQFTNNTGGTFTIEGLPFSTGNTSGNLDIYTTGGTLNGSVLNLVNSSGGTIAITGFRTTDNTITGGTYDSGSLKLFNNTGGTIHIDGFFTSDDIPTQDLQSVTDNGRRTTNVIQVESLDLHDGINDTYSNIGLSDRIWSFTTDESTTACQIDIYGGFAMYSQGSGKTWRLNGSNLTSDVTHFIPNNKNSRTLVLSVNGAYADADGNIEVSFTGGTQDLQSVTDIGATTTQDISITDGASLFVDGNVLTNTGYFFKASGGDDGEYNLLYSSDGNPAIYGINGTNIFEVYGEGGGIKGTNAGTGHYSWGFRMSGFTANRELRMPNASGMIPLTVNGQGADINGNITISVTGVGSTDTYTTGSSFSNNILSIRNNTGGTISTLINNFSGLTVGGAVSASTYYGDGSHLTGLSFINIFNSDGTIASERSINTNSKGITFSGVTEGIQLALTGNSVGLGVVPSQSYRLDTLGSTRLGRSTGDTLTLSNWLGFDYLSASQYARLSTGAGGIQIQAGKSLSGTRILLGTIGGNVSFNTNETEVTAGDINATSGITNVLKLSGRLVQNTGNTTINYLNINPILQSSSGWTGTVVGIYYNPTINVATNGTHIAFQNVLGDNLFNSTSGNTGVGVPAATNRFHVSASTNPVRIQGLSSGSDTSVVTIDGSGVLHTLPLSGISGTTGTGTTFNPDLTFNTQTGSTYTLVLGDGSDKVVVEMNSSSSNTLTVPPNSIAAFNVGCQITVVQKGSGNTTIAGGAGVTINSADGSLNLRGQYSFATLIKQSTNTWYMVGDVGTSGSIVDTYTTGGTYSSGTATFTKSDGSTYSVGGFYTGSTDVYVTGGTYSNGTATLRNSTGGTFNITGFLTGSSSTDTYTTGATFSGNLLSLNNNTGGTVSVNINNFTGLTVGGAISATSVTATTVAYQQPANSFKANNTSATTYTTDQVFKDVAEKTYTGTISWTGTAAPAGTTNHVYSWSQIGRTVHLQIVLNYSSGSTATSQVTLDMPSDCPSPWQGTGLAGANNFIVRGTGGFAIVSSGNAAAIAPGIRRDSTDTKFEINMQTGAATHRLVYINIDYRTA